MDINTAKAFYNTSGVPEDNGPFTQRSEMLIDRIRNQCLKVVFKNARVLDIGCGNGRYTFAFEKIGAKSVGLDCADKIIEYAKNIAKTINSQSDFICADALDMPFESEEFDVVFLVGNNIVEFSFDDFKTMSESIYRILKIDGKFCISMNDCQLHNNGKTIDCSTLDCISGEKISKYEIPGKGSFEYRSYYWTVAFARFILLPYFKNISIEQADEKRFWIECTK